MACWAQPRESQRASRGGLVLVGLIQTRRSVEDVISDNSFGKVRQVRRDDERSDCRNR